MFDNKSFHSNIKTDSQLLKLAIENLICHTCVRQHMRVSHPLNVMYLLQYIIFCFYNFFTKPVLEIVFHNFIEVLFQYYQLKSP